VRLLLVNPNRAREPFPVPPLGLACVAAAAARAGHEVRLLDLAFGDWRGILARGLDDFEPEALGLSVRNVDNALREHYESYLPHTRRVADALGGYGRPLILGGPGFSIFPERLLDDLAADYGIIGEGEEALPLLLDALASGSPLGDVPGLVWRSAGRIIANPQRPGLPLGALPPPAHSLIDYHPYEAEAGFAAVQTKRGCPERCIYCVYPRLEGRRHRLRPAGAVADEMATLAGRGVGHVFLADAAFNQPAAHAEAVCAELLRQGVRLRWMAYLNPRGLTSELCRLFKRSGCIGAELGIDSASDDMLASLGKGFGQTEVIAASKALRQAGIPQALFYLAGGPGETRATLREGLRALSRHTHPNLVAVNIGLRVLPGTPLAGMAGQGGGLGPHFYVSPALDAAALRELLAFCHRHSRFATPRDLGHPLTRALTAGMVRLKLRPWWRHAWLNGWQRRLFFWLGR
jgi:radical SAM superfamily enzyme YgiQ (UPF0313 family)